jgi:hypothetical protein
VYIQVGSNGDGADMALTMMQKFWNSTSQVKEKMLNSLIELAMEEIFVNFQLG